MDVAVDIRKGSPTYGNTLQLNYLEKINGNYLFQEVLHMVLVLSDTATFAYKVDNTYAPEFDAGIRWNDKELNIQMGY